MGISKCIQFLAKTWFTSRLNYHFTGMMAEHVGCNKNRSIGMLKMQLDFFRQESWWGGYRRRVCSITTRGSWRRMERRGPYLAGRKAQGIQICHWHWWRWQSDPRWTEGQSCCPCPLQSCFGPWLATWHIYPWCLLVVALQSCWL